MPNRGLKTTKIEIPTHRQIDKYLDMVFYSRGWWWRRKPWYMTSGECIVPIISWPCGRLQRSILLKVGRCTITKTANASTAGFVLIIAAVEEIQEARLLRRRMFIYSLHHSIAASPAVVGSAPPTTSRHRHSKYIPDCLNTGRTNMYTNRKQHTLDVYGFLQDVW